MDQKPLLKVRNTNYGWTSTCPLGCSSQLAMDEIGQPELMAMFGSAPRVLFLGFKDDYEKISKNNTKGLSAKQKMFWQTALAAIVCYYNYYYIQNPATAGVINIPYTKSLSFNLGIFIFLLAYSL